MAGTSAPFSEDSRSTTKLQKRNYRISQMPNSHSRGSHLLRRLSVVNIMRIRTASTSLVLASILVTMAGCAAAPINKPIKVGDSNTGAGTVNAARQYLEGRWSLESFEVYPAGKPQVTLKGDGTL